MGKRKRLGSILLAAMLCVSLCSCAQKEEQPTVATMAAKETEETLPAEAQTSEEDTARENAIAAFREYVVAEGSKISNVYVYTVDTDLPDTNVYALVNGDAVILSLSYTLGRMTSDTVQFVDTTILYLAGYEDQQPGAYYLYQKNAATVNGTETSLGAGSHLEPKTFQADSVLTFVDIQRTENNADAEITDSFVAAASDGVNTLLEIVSEVLGESGLNLTLEDFGFECYEIDSARPSDIRSGAWVTEPVEPAPISIQVRSLKNNSAGTPELTMQFTNTGEKEIVALDFYVLCYDAYGEAVKGYGRYDVYSGTYQDASILPGKSSPSDWYWALYGFDTAKSVKVAVVKYKLAGEDAVEIPEAELIWVE